MNSKRIYNTKLVLSIMLIISMVLSMIPAYAMTGQVVMNEACVTSWDDLVTQFGGAEPNKVVIPEDTTVYVDGTLRLESGDFTITGGGTLQRGKNGEALFVLFKSSVILENITIDGESSSGVEAGDAAIIVSGSTLNIKDGAAIQNCVNISNISSHEGGAIHNDDGTVNIMGGTIRNNGTQGLIVGGAIHNNGGIVNITDGLLTDNKTENKGGAIYSYNGTVNITGGTFSNNEANAGGAIYSYNGTVNIDGGMITNNKANNGGAIYSDESSIFEGESIFNMTDGAISNNEAAAGGGGIYFSGEGKPTISGGIISNNTATRNGGGINIYEGSLEISGGTILNNKAIQEGGGIHLGGQFDCVFEMTGGEIKDNIAEKGGGVFSYWFHTKVGGTAYIFNNTDTNGNKSNVRLDRYGNKSMLELEEPLLSTAQIGVHTNYDYVGCVVVEPLAGYTITNDDNARFMADSDEYSIGFGTGLDTTNLVLKIGTTATNHNIKGTIRNQGKPLSGVNVELFSSMDTAALKTTTTDAQGYYEFADMPNGQYNVKVIFGEGKEATAIVADADEIVNFSMNTGGIATFKISGNVKDDKGQALENVAVNLLDANSSGKLMNTTTDASGNYKFENLRNGSYIVEAIGEDGKATKTAAITNSNIEVYLEIAAKKPVDPGEGGGDTGGTGGNTGGGTGGGDTETGGGGGNTGGGNTGGGNTGGGDTGGSGGDTGTGGGNTGGGNTGGGDTGGSGGDTGTGGGNTGGGNTGGGNTSGGGTGGGNTTPPTEEKPTPPTGELVTKPILPVAPEQPVPSEPIPFPADEPSEPPVYEEENTDTIFEIPIIDEPAVPNENISEEVVDNEVSEDEMTGASNRFTETFKKILLVAAISLMGLLLFGLLWFILFAWYRRVKVFNQINTDEYKEDEWSLIHKTFIKKEDKGIYYLLLPKEIIGEFVTNINQVVLKEAFVQRHNGDIMMIRIKDTDLAYSARIDSNSNIIKFNYDDFKVEEQ